MIILSTYASKADMKKAGAHPVTINNEPSMTKQSFKDELDVNNIIKKYTVPELKQMAEDFEGIYGDFDEIDYQTALTKISHANDVFMNVPVKIRQQFGNDPGKFIDYATDPSNIESLREMGLAHPEPPKPHDGPIKVMMVNGDKSNVKESDTLAQ